MNATPALSAVGREQHQPAVGHGAARGAVAKLNAEELEALGLARDHARADVPAPAAVARAPEEAALDVTRAARDPSVRGVREPHAGERGVGAERNFLPRLVDARRARGTPAKRHEGEHAGGRSNATWVLEQRSRGAAIAMVIGRSGGTLERACVSLHRRPFRVEPPECRYSSFLKNLRSSDHDL